MFCVFHKSKQEERKNTKDKSKKKRRLWRDRIPQRTSDNSCWQRYQACCSMKSFQRSSFFRLEGAKSTTKARCTPSMNPKKIPMSMKTIMSMYNCDINIRQSAVTANTRYPMIITVFLSILSENMPAGTVTNE